MSCCLDKGMAPIYGWGSKDLECVEDRPYSWAESILVHNDGAVYRGEILLGYTDPRRLAEHGKRFIYKDGEIVGSFIVNLDINYHLAK